MTTRAQIEEAWFDFCVKYTSNSINDQKVIFAEEVSGEAAPRPKKPFITIKLISGPTNKAATSNLRFEGNPDLGAANIDWSLNDQVQRVVSLQAFGKNSEDELRGLQRVMDSFDVVSHFKKNGDIAIVNKGTILDISAQIDVGFERRHSLDITFNHADHAIVQEGAIEKTAISGKLKTADGDEIIVDEFEVEQPAP